MKAQQDFFGDQGREKLVQNHMSENEDLRKRSKFLSQIITGQCYVEQWLLTSHE